MARFYVPLDVNYQFDDKILRAGPMAECLYIRSLALVKRTASEGQLHRSHLTALALGLTGRAQKLADTLVEVGLWEPTDDGWYITGWLKHNLSNCQLADKKAAIRAKSIKGNHTQHHVAKGINDPDCALCNPPPRDAEPSPQGAPQGDEVLPTEEEDEPKTNRTEDEREREREREDEPKSSSSSVELTLVATPPPDDDDRITRAIDYHARTVSTGQRSPNGYARTVRETDRTEHGPALEQYLHRWPDATAEELAVRVLGITFADIHRLGGTSSIPNRDNGTRFIPGAGEIAPFVPEPNIRQQTRTLADIVKQTKGSTG